jgi:hypothetical protein
MVAALFLKESIHIYQSKKIFIPENGKLHSNSRENLKPHIQISGRLCWLVVRVPGYRSRGPGTILGTTNFFRSSRSGTRSTEELLGRKSSSSGLESRDYGCMDPLR